MVQNVFLCLSSSHPAHAKRHGQGTRRVTGMMPHPERFIRWTQHPHWTRLKSKDGIADGMTIFNNAVNYVRKS